MKKKTFLIHVIDSDFYEFICGSCHGVIYGYDEIFCPSCGAKIDMNNVLKLKEKVFESLPEK